MHKVDAVAEEAEVEGDDEAAVGHHGFGAEDGEDEGEAEEGGVVEDEGELAFVSGVAGGVFEGVFVEEEFAEDGEGTEDEGAGAEAEKEVAEGGLVEVGGEGAEEGGRHGNEQEDIDELFVGAFGDPSDFAEEETKEHDNADHREAGVEDV